GNSTTPITGCNVVNGCDAALGRAAEIFRSNVDLPAFGYPTKPASAIVRNSSRKCPCSPPSPSVYWRGARLRQLLKWTFPFPPAPPRQSTNSCSSRVRSTIGSFSIFDFGFSIVFISSLSVELPASSNRQTIVPNGTLTILLAPERPAIFFPIPCPP